MNQLNRHREYGFIHDVVVERMVDGRRMYCVIGERTGQNFGCYRSRAAAEERLRQIERFADD